MVFRCGLAVQGLDTAAKRNACFVTHHRKGWQMRRFMTLRVLVVGMVLVTGLSLVVLFRGKFRSSPAVQQGLLPTQVVSSSSSLGPAPANACEACLQPCFTNCARYAQFEDRTVTPSCQDTCLQMCADRCNSGGGSNRKSRPLRYKLKPRG